MLNAFASVAHEETSMQHLVLQIVQSLVDDVASATVDSLEKDGVITLNIHVAPSDTGKLIGKQGRTARSLRTLISAAGMKLHHRYALNIEENPLAPGSSDLDSLNVD